MNSRKRLSLNKSAGFTMVELMIVLFILTLMLGVVFSQMNTAMQRMNGEQTRLDYFGEVRDFVDQFFRDINQIGDPNPRMFDLTSAFWSPAIASPTINDSRFAVGLTKIDANELHFEGSVNGVGTVQSVQYMINGSTTCTLCLQRSQIDKQTGDPLTGQGTPNWGTEVNDVVTNPIFTYYDTTGAQITSLPVDIGTASGKNTIVTVKTIHISLQVRNPNVVDPQTGQPVEGTFEGEVSLNNCSMVATGVGISCQ